VLHPKAPPACAGHWGAGGAGLPRTPGTTVWGWAVPPPPGEQSRARGGVRGCTGYSGHFPSSRKTGKWSQFDQGRFGGAQGHWAMAARIWAVSHLHTPARSSKGVILAWV